MKKYMLIVLLLYLSTHVCAQEKGFGIGALVGEPSGLSFKLWISEKSAFDAGVAWSFWNSRDPNAQQIDFDNSKFQFHIDYLFHFLNDKETSPDQLLLFAGIGGRFRIGDDFIGIGCRLPLGFAYPIPNSPIDIFLEIVPVLGLYPATVFTGNIGLGIRWFFS